jgi:hypothetical protein
VWDGHWSEQIAKHCVWLSALVEFEDAHEIFDRIGHIPISTSSVWRRVKRWGARGQALEAAQRALATALPPRAEIVAGEARQPRDLRVAVLRILIGDNCGRVAARLWGAWCGRGGLELGRGRSCVALRFIYSFQPTALGSG